MMKKIFLFVFMFSLLALNLAACNSDASEQNGKAYENLLQNCGAIAQGDNGYFLTYNSRFFYLDKESYELSPVCKDATCSHSDIGCLHNKYISCIKNYDGRILLVYKISGVTASNTIIYELNQDTYELTEYYTVNTDFDLGYFEIINNNLIFSAADYEGEESGWYIEDMESGERKLLLDRLGYRSSIGIDENNLYLSTTEFEIYSINLETLEKKLIVNDYCRDLILHNGRIYFLRYDLEKQAADLHSVKTDGSDEQLIKEYVFSFRVWNDKIYYISDNKDIMAGNTLNMMDLDGKSETVLVEKQERTYDIYILPDEGKVICFNVADSEQEKTYAMMDFDGGNLFSGDVPDFE